MHPANPHWSLINHASAPDPLLLLLCQSQKMGPAPAYYQPPPMAGPPPQQFMTV
jgi:hypothetical protein